MSNHHSQPHLTTAMREVCQAMYTGARLLRLVPGKAGELLTDKSGLTYTRTLAKATLDRLEESQLIEWSPAMTGTKNTEQASLTKRGQRAGKPPVARFKARITTATMVAEVEGPLLGMSDMLVYISDPADRAGVIRHCVESHTRNDGGELLEQVKSLRIGLHNRCQLNGASAGFSEKFWVAVEAVLQLMPGGSAAEPKLDAGENRD